MIHKDQGVETVDGFRIRTEPLRETLYRYRAIDDRLRDILVNDEIYFATPEACNDPFDCRFEASLEDPVAGLRAFLAEQQIFAQILRDTGQPYDGPMAEELAPSARLAEMTKAELAAHAEAVFEKFGFGNADHQRAVKERIETARERIGIACFAGRGDNLLMHAHYGGQHAGCCLEFQVRNDEGDRASIFDDPSLQFRDVAYQDAPPSVALYEMGTLDTLFSVTLTKHTRWRYEEEVRVVRFRGPGPVRYRRDTLTGLIFGCAARDDQIERALGWLGERPGVTLSKAEITRDGGLTLVPL